ncbi:MAG: glycosyltransferase family 39 protein [Candidatus Omnitrophica bacterium]|nr:glycosyltransferase family 39 protein [Candidatus Omnitrophota bacterium]
MALKPFVKRKVKWWEVGILFLILIISCLVRLPYVHEPFECDQASYSYIANHWGEGMTPYRYSWDSKPPLIFVAYRIISAFLGTTAEGIHLGFIFLAAISVISIYALSRRLFNPGFALISAFLYGSFSGGALISGTFAVPENLLVILVIAGMYYFWDGWERQKNKYFFVSGAFLGLAMMTKQSAVWETAALTLFLISGGLRSTTFLLIGWRLVLFWLGVAVVIAIFVLLFSVLGALYEFFSSVFLYNLFFGRIVGIKQGLINLGHALIWSPRENFLLWVFAVSGCILSLAKRERKSMFINLWFFATLLGLVSALNFYPHYFIQIIPVIVILAVYFLQSVWELPGLGRKVLSIIFVCGAAISFGAVQWKWWFCSSVLDSLASRRGELARPELYRQAEEVGDFIRNHSVAEDVVQVWGMWPEVYYNSKRKSPSKYFYIASRNIMLGKFKEVVQTQVYYDIIRNPPKFIIIDEYFADLISEPMQRYINGGYALERQGERYLILNRRDTVY